MGSFIEVLRITQDKDSNNVVRHETINTSDISNFRPWHKGKNDNSLEGHITLVVLWKSRDKERISSKDKETKPILIHESYESFSKRLGVHVIKLGGE